MYLTMQTNLQAGSGEMTVNVLTQDPEEQLNQNTMHWYTDAV